MARSSLVQLGVACTAWPLAKERSSRPVLSSTTTSEIPPRFQRIAAMRSPACDQRGSVPWTSSPPSVIGVMRRPSGERCRRRRESADTSNEGVAPLAIGTGKADAESLPRREVEPEGDEQCAFLLDEIADARRPARFRDIIYEQRSVRVRALAEGKRR